MLNSEKYVSYILRGVPRNFFRGGGSIFLLTHTYFNHISVFILLDKRY
jgi:hypothetical protein